MGLPMSPKPMNPIVGFIFVPVIEMKKKVEHLRAKGPGPTFKPLNRNVNGPGLKPRGMALFIARLKPHASTRPHSVRLPA